jgi:hypothetical protein
MVALPFIGLALTVLAARAGVRPARLFMVALHLLIAGLSGAGSILMTRVLARRARRQRKTGVPWGVRLRRPLWVRLDVLSITLWAGGLLAALPAAAGLSSVSVGVLLTLSVVGLGTMFGDTLMSPGDLTFEDAGLRMHLGAVSFQVPWELISRVEPVGPDQYRVVQLHISDRAALVASTDPATGSARAKIERRLAAARKGTGVSILTMPWTAGLDGVVLQRAIEAGRRREPQRGGALN